MITVKEESTAYMGIEFWERRQAEYMIAEVTELSMLRYLNKALSLDNDISELQKQLDIIKQKRRRKLLHNRIHSGVTFPLVLLNKIF